MKFVAHVRTHKVGSECQAEFEFDDEILAGVPESERENLLWQAALEALVDSDQIEVWFVEEA